MPPRSVSSLASQWLRPEARRGSQRRQATAGTPLLTGPGHRAERSGGYGDVGSFHTTAVSLSAGAEANSAVFAPGASAFTVSVPRGVTLSISGVGLMNNSSHAELYHRRRFQRQTGNDSVQSKCERGQFGLDHEQRRHWRRLGGFTSFEAQFPHTCVPKCSSELLVSLPGRFRSLEDARAAASRRLQGCAIGQQSSRESFSCRSHVVDGVPRSARRVVNLRTGGDAGGDYTPGGQGRFVRK